MYVYISICIYVYIYIFVHMRVQNRYIGILASSHLLYTLCTCTCRMGIDMLITVSLWSFRSEFMTSLTLES